MTEIISGVALAGLIIIFVYFLVSAASIAYFKAKYVHFKRLIKETQEDDNGNS